jgi:glycosyltransferase involved in cell wall biosynthesis
MATYKIALVTDKYLPIFGGLEILLHDLAHELSLRGHRPEIICATPGGPDRERFAVHRLDVPRLLYRARSPAALGLLAERLRSGGFDLVHAHCVFSPLAHAATYLGRKLGIPSVFTLHSVLRGAGAGLSLLQRAAGWGSWPTVSSAVSNHVAAELRAITGRRDVELVLNAAHLDRWRLERKEELRIASAMRFTLRKRPVALVRLFARLRARLPPSLRPKLLLVGDGPERPAVERAVARLGLGAHVELPGFLPQPALAQALARSALFAVPCARVALSIAAFEARAAGLPVVARIPSGVAEVVEHGKHGLLARSDDELVAALERLVRDPALRARMSAAAQQDLDRFSWPRCIERHEQLYALALARGAAG